MTRSRRRTCRITFICLMLAAVPGPSLWGEEPVTRKDVVFTDAQPRQATLDALASPVEFEFFDTPLSDVAAELSDIYSIDILIDNVALEALGLDASEPITATVNGISLRSGLASILGALELVAVPVPLGIRITSEEEATATLTHAIYPVDDLLQGPRALTQEELIEAILTSLAPETWDQVGGDGGLRFFRGNLIVVQSWDVHQQLRGLLHALRSTRTGPFESKVDASINAERDRQLQQIMKAHINVEFFDLPLGDAMQELTDQLQLPIHIDAVSLEMLGLDSSEPITLSLKDQPAGEVLRLMLRPLELDWITRNEAIWIVSEETASSDMTCRLYPIERLRTPPMNCRRRSSTSWRRIPGPIAAVRAVWSRWRMPPSFWFVKPTTSIRKLTPCYRASPSWAPRLMKPLLNRSPRKSIAFANTPMTPRCPSSTFNCSFGNT